ncbi:MAG: transposase [Planctomycetota bacterium]|nr:transposase [Planctomycetota bacterium]
MGYGTSTLDDLRLTPLANRDVEIKLGPNSIVFRQLTDGSYAAPEGLRFTLSRVRTEWHLRSLEGVVTSFNGPGVRRPIRTDPRMPLMAKLVDVGSIGSYFGSLSDYRHARNSKHLMVDIAVIAACGVVCGCDGPTAIHRWAKHRASWLARHLASPDGVPSRDCTRRLLMARKAEAFQRRFRAWIRDAVPTDAENSGRPVAIDGKTCRGSHDEANLGQQPELAAAVRRDAPEAPSRRGQPPRKDDVLHAQRGLPYASPVITACLICAGPAQRPSVPGELLPALPARGGVEPAGATASRAADVGRAGPGGGVADRNARRAGSQEVLQQAARA